MRCDLAFASPDLSKRAVGSTYTSLHYQVVFSTKDREPLLGPAVRGRMYAYLGGVARDKGMAPLAIGGVHDHVHLLLGLKPTHCLADCVRDIKRASALWSGFRGQDGYAAFTVGASGIRR